MKRNFAILFLPGNGQQLFDKITVRKIHFDESVSVTPGARRKPGRHFRRPIRNGS
jgi:hypothetical protein